MDKNKNYYMICNKIFNGNYVDDIDQFKSDVLEHLRYAELVDELSCGFTYDYAVRLCGCSCEDLLKVLDTSIVLASYYASVIDSFNTNMTNFLGNFGKNLDVEDES